MARSRRWRRSCNSRPDRPAPECFLCWARGVARCRREHGSFRSCPMMEASLDVVVRCVAARSPASRPASAACFIPFPFLIPNLGIALKLAYAVVICELITIAFIRYRFMGGELADTIVQVVIGGGIVFAIGVWLGQVGAS